MPFSLQARVVFPVERPPIEHGVVTIDGERIVAVGTQAAGGELVDLGPVAILPGLVNAHTHLEFSDLSQPLGKPGMRLVDWIRLVIAERGRHDRELGTAIALGLSESLGHGVTALGDIATAGAFASPATLDVVQFAEVIGFSRARGASALAATIARLEAIEAACGRSCVGVSPHAPYTVSVDLLQQLIALACDRALPVAMHVAESKEELEFLRSGAGPFQELLAERSMWDAQAIPRDTRPLDYLRMLAQAPRSLVIHGNYLDAEERALLAAERDRMSLVYCPRTHRYFDHPPYPLGDLLAAGVRIALGTDSRASNPDLSLLAEMRCAARMHPQVDPVDILRMGTLAGAQALGCGAEIGRLAPGSLANLVAIPVSESGAAKPNELLAGILAGQTAPCAVWHRGKKL